MKKSGIALKRAKARLKKAQDDVARAQKAVSRETLHKLSRSGVHDVFRSGDYPNFKYEATCGARKLIKKKKFSDNDIDTPYTNLTYYESEVTCPKCKKLMRPHAGKCHKCGVEFDGIKETYCGNCGEDTRKPYNQRRKKK